MLRDKLLVIIFLCTNLTVSAQSGVNSPYSAFSIGEFNNGSQAPYMSMGNARIAMTDSTLLNIANPASYSFIAYQLPIFNMDINYSFTQSSTDQQSATYNNSSLNNFTMGIPISKKWGAAFGINPFSQVGYDLLTLAPFLVNDTLQYRYQGSGGANRVFLGLSYAPVMNDMQALSFGVNGSYLFGKADRERTVIFPQRNDYLNGKVVNSLRFRDFFYDLGMIYSVKFLPNQKFTLATTIGPEAKITTYNDILSYSFRYTGGGQVVEQVYDTIQFVDSLRGTITLPQRLTFGFSYEIKPNQSKRNFLNKPAQYYRILFNGELEIQEWSKYNENFNNFQSDYNLSNSMRVSFGTQITPNDGSAGKRPTQSYLSFVNYRFGARYLSTKLNLNDTQIMDFGISFGIGLPLGANAGASINFGSELGRRGTTNNGLIQEEYMNFYFGISLIPDRFSKWFVKRKFD